jgi:pimeloyl-ACP methyl ester carboxylesterase
MGFGMRGQVWKPQIEGLSARHRVAWFDARGIGQSESSDGRFGMDDMVRDAVRVLDSLGWAERTHLVGVSMGGMVAQHLALARPDRFSSLALIATTPGGGLRAKLPTYQGLYLFARANLASQAVRKKVLLSLLYTPEFVVRADPGKLEARMEEQMGVRAPRSTLRSQLRAVLSHDVTARLPEIRLPTLVIRPDRDILVRPESSDRLAAGIPNARLLALPDAGHGALFQCAEDVNRALEQHFERVAAAS